MWLALLIFAIAHASDCSRALGRFLVLDDEVTADLVNFLRETDRAWQPDAVIFMGSRAHKLWRGKFDVDFALVGERRSPPDSEYGRLRDQALERHRLSFDKSVGFRGKVTIPALAAAGHFITAEDDRRLRQMINERLPGWTPLGPKEDVSERIYGMARELGLIERFGEFHMLRTAFVVKAREDQRVLRDIGFTLVFDWEETLGPSLAPLPPTAAKRKLLIRNLDALARHRVEANAVGLGALTDR